MNKLKVQRCLSTCEMALMCWHAPFGTRVWWFSVLSFCLWLSAVCVKFMKFGMVVIVHDLFSLFRF